MPFCGQPGYNNCHDANWWSENRLWSVEDEIFLSRYNWNCLIRNSSFCNFYPNLSIFYRNWYFNFITFSQFFWSTFDINPPPWFVALVDGQKIYVFLTVFLRFFRAIPQKLSSFLGRFLRSFFRVV